MQPRRCKLFTITNVVILMAFLMPCSAQPPGRGGPPRDQNQTGEGKIQWEEGRRGPRGRGGPLSDEVIDRVLEEIKKKKPEKAKELAELRKKDPAKFGEELREHGREHFGKIAREAWEARRKEGQEEFLNWLKEEYPEEARSLDTIRASGDAEVYEKKFEIAERKYGHIHRSWRWNPEMGKILKEDLALKELRDEIVERIKGEDKDSKKAELRTNLKRVVARRFDLIVRRKQLAYEELQKRLEELQKLIRESRDDLIKAQDKDYKDENVDKRMKDLLEEKQGFQWPD